MSTAPAANDFPAIAKRLAEIKAEKQETEKPKNSAVETAEAMIGMDFTYLGCC